jgi:HEPN domain-containing protein
MTKPPNEWLLQADYDMETADAMFDKGRYIYTVFMCHLAIEKALKGLYHKRLTELPPKVHNLLYLAEKTGLNFPEHLNAHMVSLNRLSIPTRYPEDLGKTQTALDKVKSLEILEQSRKVLEWIKTQF